MSQIRRLFDGAATELGILPLEAVANDQTVSLGAPFNGTALAQPAISAAATVSLGAPFGGATLHQPSLLATANIGMGKPFNNTLVTQPAVLLENPQTVILLNNKFTAVVWQPAVTPGAVNIALSLIGPTATVNAPGVAQGITLNAIAATTTSYSPAIVADGAVVLNAIAATTTTHQPAVSATATIAPNAIASGAVVRQPSLAQPSGQTIAVPLLSSPASVHSPAVAQVVQPSLISSSTVLAQLSLTTAAVVLPSALSATGQLFNPAVQPGAASILLNALGSGASVLDPSIAPGAVTVQASFLSSGSSVFNPAVSAASAILPNALASGATVRQLGVTTEAFVAPSAIGGGNSVAQPSIVSAFINPQVIGATGTIPQPSLSSLATIAPAAFQSGGFLDLAVLPGPVSVSLDALSASSSLPAVIVAPGPVYISPDVLGPLVLFHLLEVAGEARPAIRTPKMMVRWRDDNKEWSREVTIDLGNIGETEVVRRLNFTGMFTTRQYEFTCTEDVAVIFAGAEEDIEFMS